MLEIIVKGILIIIMETIKYLIEVLLKVNLLKYMIMKKKKII